MTIGDPRNARREKVRVAAADPNLVLEARLRDCLHQRDELLEAIELWMDAVEADPGNAAYADEDLMECFRRVREQVWEGT